MENTAPMVWSLRHQKGIWLCECFEENGSAYSHSIINLSIINRNAGYHIYYENNFDWPCQRFS